MGEYAKYNGQDIKIGTCEDLYYLRADQIGLIQPDSKMGLNPRDPQVQRVIRFRFPWPQEDDIEPGAFDDPFFAVAIHGLTVPEGVEHSSVQFRADVGYLLSIPCPEGPEALASPRVAKNGWRGNVRLVQQGYRDGALVAICECGGCGAKYRVPPSDMEAMVVACRAEADRKMRENEDAQARSDRLKEGYTFNLDPAKEWWHIIADRIEAGYRVAVPA